MASIRRQRNKWQAQIRRVGHQPISRTFILKTDAEAWARKTERHIDSGDLMVDQRVLKQTTVRDLFIRSFSRQGPPVMTPARLLHVRSCSRFASVLNFN